MEPANSSSRISVRQNGELVPIVANVLRRSPTLAERGVLMEHHAIGPSVFPRREVQSHVVYLHTGASVQADVESRSFRGRRWIRPGTVWVMPRGSEHAVQFHSRVEGLSLSFDPARFAELLPPTSAREEQLLGEQLLVARKQLQHTMWALWHESLAPSEPGLLAAESLAMVLASMLLQSSGSGEPAGRAQSGGLSGRQLTTILDLVRDNVSERLSLSTMASAVGLSSFHFLRAFKVAAGCTPHQFVLEQRMEVAKELLRDRRRSIAEVGMLVGFAYPSHFARRFRKQVGVSPNEFRRSL